MEKYDLISRKEAKRAIKIRCILNHIPFKSDTPEGQRALEALEAVRSAPSIDVEDLPIVKELRCKLKCTMEINERYAAAARVIALYLNEFCDKDLPYDEMIADAARKAAATLEKYQNQDKANKSVPMQENGKVILTITRHARPINTERYIPHKCPICGGRGIVQGGFYSTTNNSWTTNRSVEPCRQCSGTGII